jgi:hypothetical protein
MGNRAEAIMQGYETIQSLMDVSQATGFSHRFHVIEFGTSARQRPDLSTTITFDPNRSPGAVAALKNKIRAGLLGYNLGNTDTKAAFQEVQKLIGRLGNVPPDHLHIILVTDGKPFVAGASTDIGSPYQHELDTLVSDLRKHATLDVIGITGNGLDVYWPAWGPFWTQLSGGRAFAGAKGTEISLFMDRILRERLGLPAQNVATNPYYCPPYLRSITFTVFRSQRGGRAQIKDASGRLVTPGMPGVSYVNEVTYDRITIDDPPPGLWELDKLASKITVDMLYKQVDRLEPKDVVNAQIPTQLKYKVLSDRQQPFQPLPNYPVQASVQVTEADGRQTTIALVHQGQGVFVADKAFEFTAIGAARLLMTGSTVLPDNSTVTVFTNDEKLTVTNKTLLVLNAGTSLPGEVPLWFGRRKMSPTISIQQFKDGNALPPSAVSGLPNELLQFRLVSFDGQQIGEWQKMTVAGNNFVATTNARVSLWTLDWLLRHKEVFAEVRVNEAALRPDFAIKELKRNGPEPGVVRDNALAELRYSPLALPLLLRESMWTFAILVGLVLIVVSAGSYWGYRYLRKLLYYISDTWIWRQRVTLVIQPAFQDEILRSLTNDYRASWKGPAVKIKVGNEDKPDWKPAWLKVKRLFRPWAGELVVKVRYPVKIGKKENKHSVILTAPTANLDGPSSPLTGVPANVQAVVRVKRRGKDLRNQMV